MHICWQSADDLWDMIRYDAGERKDWATHQEKELNGGADELHGLFGRGDKALICNLK